MNLIEEIEAAALTFDEDGDPKDMVAYMVLSSSAWDELRRQIEHLKITLDFERHTRIQAEARIAELERERDAALRALERAQGAEADVFALMRERDEVRVMPHIETVASNVHAAWVQAKQSAGIKSRLAEDGEELMVPYAELSDKQQEMDRLLVRQVYDAIGKAREMK